MGGETLPVILKGLGTDLLFTSYEGEAADSDGDGLDEIRTELFQLALMGDSSLGPLALGLRDPARSPFQPSVGEIEETADSVPGRLDLPPYSAGGSAQSLFEVFFQVEISGTVYHNQQPLMI